MAVLCPISESCRSIASKALKQIQSFDFVTSVLSEICSFVLYTCKYKPLISVSSKHGAPANSYTVRPTISSTACHTALKFYVIGEWQLWPRRHILGYVEPTKIFRTKLRLVKCAPRKNYHYWLIIWSTQIFFRSQRPVIVRHRQMFKRWLMENLR